MGEGYKSDENKFQNTRISAPANSTEVADVDSSARWRPHTGAAQCFNHSARPHPRLCGTTGSVENAYLTSSCGRQRRESTSDLGEAKCLAL